MIRCVLLAVGALAAGGAALAAQEALEPAPAMAAAANSFLSALDPPKRAKARLPFNSDERLNWDFVPRERKGVSIKEMSSEQRRAALALLKSSLSAGGFTKAEAILHLEEVLFAVSGSTIRDPELYYFTVFGEPSKPGAWGWRYEGHHISLNWTVVDGKLVASTPQFLGANPADVRDGPQKGRRALAAEEDLGRALVKSIKAGPGSAQAIPSKNAPDEILTGSSRQAAIQEHTGISYGKLTEEQQGLLLSLIREYASVQPPSQAQARLARVKAELPSIKFAWMGGLEKGQGHYYRIQGFYFPDRVRQHSEQRKPHPHRVARIQGRLGRRPSGRALPNRSAPRPAKSLIGSVGNWSLPDSTVSISVACMVESGPGVFPRASDRLTPGAT